MSCMQTILLCTFFNGQFTLYYILFSEIFQKLVIFLGMVAVLNLYRWIYFWAFPTFFSIFITHDYFHLSLMMSTMCSFEALHYKSEGRRINSWWCHLNFPLTSFRPHYGPGFDSASNRNEYQEYFLGGKGGRCIGLTTLPPLCADCVEIWEPQHPGTLRACAGL